jgi:FkbM family methyltransferase
MHGHSLYFYNPENPAWQNLFPFLKKNFNVIDAGANIGILSMMLAKRCPEGTTYSFEPDTGTFDFLRNHIVLNKLENVRLYKNAVGDSAGVFNLYKMYENNPGANRILMASPDATVKSEKVEVTTLDERMLNGDFDPIHLVKMDIEGFELFCLKGAKKLIERWKPILFIELSTVNLAMQNCTPADVISFVEDLRYSIRDAHTMKPVILTETVHTDIFCFPLIEQQV